MGEVVFAETPRPSGEPDAEGVFLWVLTLGRNADAPQTLGGEATRRGSLWCVPTHMPSFAPDVAWRAGPRGAVVQPPATISAIAAASPDEYKADLAIVELGGNDMPEGTSPKVVSRNLNWIVFCMGQGARNGRLRSFAKAARAA